MNILFGAFFQINRSIFIVLTFKTPNYDAFGTKSAVFTISIWKICTVVMWCVTDSARFVEGGPGDLAAIAAAHVAIGIVLVVFATGEGDGVWAGATGNARAVSVGADVGFVGDITDGIVGDAGGVRPHAGASEAVELVVSEVLGESVAEV